MGMPVEAAESVAWHDGSMAEHERPERHKTVRSLAVILPLHFAVTAFTWRDLRHRNAEEVRGGKRLWRVASGMNTLGSLLYFTLGRRRTGS